MLEDCKLNYQKDYVAVQHNRVRVCSVLLSPIIFDELQLVHSSLFSLIDQCGLSGIPGGSLQTRHEGLRCRCR